MLHRLRAVLLTSFLLCAAAYGQASAPAESPSPTAEVLVLRAQLEEVRRFQQDILSTVYWSLATVAAIAAAIIGFGWFANFKVYERDKSAMLSDLTAASREHQERLAQKQADATTAQKKEVDAKVAAVAKQAEAQATSAIKSLADRMDILDFEKLFAKYRIEKAEEGYSPRNLLQSAVSLLEAAMPLPGYSDARDDALDAISDSVEHVISTQAAGEETAIDAFLMNQVFRVLERVPAGQRPVAQRVAVRAQRIQTGS